MPACTRRYALAATALALAWPAQAQDWPNKTIRLVVPFAAGGANDLLARAAAEGAGKVLGQTVLVDNRPGAGAIIASENVARSPGDGYNLFSADNGVLVYNQALYKKLPYDPVKDFAPIGIMGRSPLIITAAPGAGIADAATLLARLKAEPGKWNIATAGTGSPHHLALELFQREAGGTLVADLPAQDFGLQLRFDETQPLLLQGRDGLWFCGAWTRYGFHEDGLLSGLSVAQQMTERWAAA